MPPSANCNPSDNVAPGHLRYARVITNKDGGHWCGRYGKIISGRLEYGTNTTLPYWTLLFSNSERYEFYNGEIEILAYDETNPRRIEEIEAMIQNS